VPTATEHQSAFDSHLCAYATTVEPHPDWAAVMLFYCAVHAVERLFAAEDIHHREHSEREYAIKTRYASIWHSYRALKSESLKTRYLQGGTFQLSPRHVREKLHTAHLARIVADIDARIAARGMLGS
jgi:hypothetical protein